MTEAVIYNDPTQSPPLPDKKPSNIQYGKHDVYVEEYNLSQKILGELIGTTLFVYGVCSCNVFGSNPACKIVGSSFMGGIIIFIFGRVSGAHFNPAVSLGLFLRHKLSLRELILYIVAQIIGGFIGCIFLALCRRGRFEELSGNQIQNYLIHTDGGIKKNAWCYISAFLFEIFGTFVLVMFVLASCERDNYLGPALGFGFSITLIALNGIGGNTSSCSLNPARSLAPALIQLMADGDRSPIKQIWIYLVGPLLGGAIAAFVWPIFIYYM